MARLYSIKIFGQKYRIDYAHNEEDSYGVTDPGINEGIDRVLDSLKELSV